MPLTGRRDIPELFHEIQIERSPERNALHTDLLEESPEERVEPSPWLKKRTYLEDGATCDLVTIRDLEHGADETGRIRTRINNEAGPPHEDENLEQGIRWL
jgi:hypothetical protein